MKIRILIHDLSMCVLYSIAQPVNAQFFKKVGNILEKVDKTINNSNTQNKNEDNTEKKLNSLNQTSSTKNSIHQATLYDKTTTMRCPTITNNTKVISIDVKPDIYVNMAPFSDGVAFVKVDKKCFFVDTLGNKILDFNYNLPSMREFPQFYQDICPVKKNMAQNMSLIDKTGKVIMELPVYDCTNFVDGIASGFISVPKGYSKITKAVYFNTKGELIYKNLIEEVKFDNLVPPVHCMKDLLPITAIQNGCMDLEIKMEI